MSRRYVRKGKVNTHTEINTHFSFLKHLMYICMHVRLPKLSGLSSRDNFFLSQEVKKEEMEKDIPFSCWVKRKP